MTPGAFGHLLTNVRGATALFPDMPLGKELVGGQVEGREGHRAGPGAEALLKKIKSEKEALNNKPKGKNKR